MSKISDINWLFYKYYSDNPKLRRIVTVHSEQVAKKALKIFEIKKLPLNPKDIFCGAMLHDIGVVKCNAPEIHAFGELPYILHGIEGEKILIHHGLNQYAKICLNHTGSGITIKDILHNNLPLPKIDMTPKTLLEKLICYADKFYSKSHDLTKEKSLDQVMNQMEKFGNDSLERFIKLHTLFHIHN